MTKTSRAAFSDRWMHLRLVALTLSLLLSACSKAPEADGPEVTVGADGVSVTLDPQDLAQLAMTLKNLSELIHQMQQLAAPAGSGESPALPGPPAGLPGPPAGLPDPPAGLSVPKGLPTPSLPALPGSGGPSIGQPEMPQELRNRMGLEVESLLSFLDDPDTPIPFKENLGRIIDLTTSGTGQFSALELEELEGEVQAILGEISGPAGLVGGPGPGPGPGPGAGPRPGPP